MVTSSAPPLSTSPMPRILTDCCPIVISRPPTLMLALPSAVMSCGNGDIVGFQLSRSASTLNCFVVPPQRIDLHHAGNGQKTPGDDVVLQRPQIGQPEMRRADDLIAVDFADQAGLLNLGDLIAGQIDVLLQADRGLRERKIEIDAVFEGNADKRQAVKRRRADIDDAGRRIEPDLHRNRIVFLHLLGGQAGRLGGDFQNDRSRVGIGFDIQLAKMRRVPRRRTPQGPAR